MKKLLILFVLIFAMLLVACGGSDTQDSSSQSDSMSEEQNDGGMNELGGDAVAPLPGEGEGGMDNVGGDAVAPLPGDDGDGVMVVNPYIQFNTKEEAEIDATFEFDIDTSGILADYTHVAYFTIDSSILEFNYATSGDIGVHTISYRKGSIPEVSGFYGGEGFDVETVTEDGIEIKLSGTDGSVFLAEWQNGDHYYSINSTEEYENKGVSKDDMISFVKSTF